MIINHNFITKNIILNLINKEKQTNIILYKNYFLLKFLSQFIYKIFVFI